MNCHLVVVGLSLLTFPFGGALRAEEPPQEVRQKSVTIYPVVITPTKDIAAEFPVRIAELLGLMAERAGMAEIEIGRSRFSPPETDDVSQIAAAFGQFVAKQRLKTEFAVFGQFVGTPQTGPQEIRAVVVDKAGKVIFADRSDCEALSRSEIKPDCPMTCTLYLASRIGTVWGLTAADLNREPAVEGKMAALMRTRSGLPSPEEIAATEQRLAAVKGNFAAATVTVYPIHLWPGSDQPSASRLAKMLNEQSLCQAEASEIDPDLEIHGDPNEQKILWDTARSLREFVRNNPPATQYALLADYALRRSADGRQSVHHVHLVLCDRSGDWVLVDYQNSHHPDFQVIAPTSRDDCNRLAALRLKRCLSE